MRLQYKKRGAMEIFDPKKHWQHPKRTIGQKSADWITHHAGSWTFILTLIGILILWIIINTMAWNYKWDPYPFILFNLLLSTLAALQAPMILMSQNRTAERDRWKAEQDYKVNKKAEKEVKQIQKDLRRLLEKKKR